MIDEMHMQKGFTLIEILTVVLIIAVLTAVALPQYRRVIERAEVTEVLSMLRSLYDSSERLAGEFGARNYQELLSKAYGDEAFYMYRLDIIPNQDSEEEALFKCELDGTELVCPKRDLGTPKWIYSLFVEKGTDWTQGGRYIVAVNYQGKYMGTQILFDREQQEILCVPEASDTRARACDVYNLDVLANAPKIDKNDLN